MKMPKKVKIGLDKKFQKVLKTPASFNFYVAIHDFVEHIELNPVLSDCLLAKTKLNIETNITNKYGYLKQIYQGVEDAQSTSGADIGHTRCMALLEINKIRNKELSETNSFWKKRELFRNLTGEIYKRLSPGLV